MRNFSHEPQPRPCQSKQPPLDQRPCHPADRGDRRGRHDPDVLRRLGRRRQGHRLRWQLRHRPERHRHGGQGERDEAPKLDGGTVDGKTFDTATLKGKVVVLNVWGSWCPPCRAEAPGFAKVSKELADAGKDVAFVGINTRDTSMQNATSFEEDFGIAYPSLYDPAGKLMLRFPKGTLNPNAIPSTIILDKEGKIAARTLAPVGEEQLRSMIDPILAEQ